MTPRGHVTRAFGSLCQKKWKKRGVKSREKEEKKVAYRAPAALCCWLFDIAILSLTLLCIAPFLKEASVQATSAFTFYYMFQRQHCNHCVAPCNEKTNTITTRLLTLLSFHPRPPNEPTLPDNTAAKLNMVAIKAGAKKPGAKTQKVVPKLRQSRLVLVKKETPPTVDEPIRPVEVTPQPVVSVSRASPSALSTLPKKNFCSTPHTLRLSTCVCQGGAREARDDRFFGEKFFFSGVVFMVHPNF